jgi:subtilisin family serine protease
MRHYGHKARRFPRLRRMRYRESRCGLSRHAPTSRAVPAAAGNYGEGNNRYYEVSITDPANAYSALGVGACDSEDPERFGVCSFSSRGPTADGREKPDIVAPGVNIESCGHLSDTDPSKQSGTSQATALVSGACALLLSQVRPGLRVRRSEVIRCLTDPAGVQPMNRVRTYQGAGQLSISSALHVAHGKGYI